MNTPVLESCTPARHVVGGQESDMAPPASIHLRRARREAVDRLGDKAAIEGVASRLDLPLAIAAGRLRLGEDALVGIGGAGRSIQRSRVE